MKGRMRDFVAIYVYMQLKKCIFLIWMTCEMRKNWLRNRKQLKSEFLVSCSSDSICRCYFHIEIVTFYTAGLYLTARTHGLHRHEIIYWLAQNKRKRMKNKGIEMTHTHTLTASDIIRQMSPIPSIHLSNEETTNDTNHILLLSAF